MAEDLDDHRRIFDGGPSTRLRKTGDDLQSAAAVRAVLDVDVEDPFEQPDPAHARRLSLGRGVIGCGRGGTLCRSGNDFTAQLRVGRQNAMGSLDQIAGDIETTKKLGASELVLDVQFSPDIETADDMLRRMGEIRKIAK